MTRRITQLLVGLFLYGFGIALMVRGAIGVSPWDVLTQGISLQTGLPFGLVTNLVGLVVLLLWIPIRQKPGIGTILNVLLVGPSAQVGLWVIPEVENLVTRVILFAGGLALVALATGLYIGARFGPGPRDGLMTGIHRKWGWRIWIVRTAIEVTVLVIGWLLGGNVGIGTLAFALLIGPMVGVTMPLLRVPEPASDEPTPREEVTT
ncbi:membrane protein YczE [Schumannella luteola]